VTDESSESVGRPYQQGLSAEQRIEIGRWLREVADLLWLRDWTIIVGSQPPSDGDAWATTTPTDNYLEALIKVHASMLSEPRDTIRRALVHELVHLHHGDLLEAVRDATKSAGDTVQDFAEATVRRYCERWVDTMARVVVARMELPSLDAVLAAPVQPEVNAEPTA
jgi:hypothetical protein